MKTRIAVLLAAITILTRASAALADCETKASDQDIQILADALKPYVKTSERPLQFYHWATRGPDSGDGRKLKMGQDEAIDLPGEKGTYHGPVSLRPEITGPDGKQIDVASDYFRKMTSHFFAAQSGNDWSLGDGLYTAPDPVVSSNFAGKPGFLLEGTRGVSFVKAMRTTRTTWQASWPLS